VDHTVMKIRSN